VGCTASLTFYEGFLYSNFNTKKKMAQASINYGDDEWTSFVGVDLVLAFFTPQRSGLCRRRLEASLLPHL